MIWHPDLVDFERPLAYDELCKMPNDGKRYEVILGELFVTQPPRRDHQEVVSNLDWILQRFLRTTGLGRVYPFPVDVWLGRNDIVRPDLTVILESRLDIFDAEGIVVKPPDLVVEVLSRNTRSTDQVRKAALYATSGVPEYWRADPDRRALVVDVLAEGIYRRLATDADGLLTSRVLPGLRVDPDEVFARLG